MTLAPESCSRKRSIALVDTSPNDSPLGLSDPSEPSIACLTSWLEKGGARITNVAIRRRDKGSGFGLFAERTIMQGEIAFQIPKSLALTPARVAESIEGKVMAAAGASPELSLWMFMALGREDPSNAWNPYLAALPCEAPDPTGWSDEMVQRELGGSGLPSLIKRARNRIEEEFNSVWPMLPLDLRERLSIERILWARGVYFSRCLPAIFAENGDATVTSVSLDDVPVVSSTTESGCLVPFLDMINHEPGHKWQLQATESPSCIRFRCLREIPEGGELFIDYGADLSNEQLLFRYGFAVKGNDCDCSTGIIICCEQSDDEVKDEKREALALEGIPCTEASQYCALLVGPFDVGGPPWCAALRPRLLRALEILSNRSQNSSKSSALDLSPLHSLRDALVFRRSMLSRHASVDAKVVEAEDTSLAAQLGAYRTSQQKALQRALIEVDDLLTSWSGEYASGSTSA